jgi:5,10-methylenetetrahydromethanopterin reductase
MQGDKRPGEYAALARLAESFGIDVLSVYADLLYQPAIGPLLEMAYATQRIRLGPAGLNPYTLHPYEIAGQVAMLDLVSRGRAYLGLVRGTWLEAVGIAQPRPLAHLAEAAAVVRALLAGETDGVAGRVFRLEPGVALRYERFRPRVPLLVGAWGPQTLALAGRIADEVKVGGAANPDVVPVVRERIAAGAAAAGRAGHDVGIVVGAVSVVDEDGAAARALARSEVAMYLAVVADLDPTAEVPADVLKAVKAHVAAGDHAAAGRAIPDDVLDRYAFAGTPDQIAAQVDRLFAAGAVRVELGTPHGLTPQHGIELIGTRVLPLLGS